MFLFFYVGDAGALNDISHTKDFEMESWITKNDVKILRRVVVMRRGCEMKPVVWAGVWAGVLGGCLAMPGAALAVNKCVGGDGTGDNGGGAGGSGFCRIWWTE